MKIKILLMLSMVIVAFAAIQPAQAATTFCRQETSGGERNEYCVGTYTNPYGESCAGEYYRKTENPPTENELKPWQEDYNETCYSTPQCEVGSPELDPVDTTPLTNGVECAAQPEEYTVWTCTGTRVHDSWRDVQETCTGTRNGCTGYWHQEGYSAAENNGLPNSGDVRHWQDSDSISFPSGCTG